MKHVINKKPFGLHVICVTQPEMCRYGCMYLYIQYARGWRFLQIWYKEKPNCAQHVASVGIRSKVNEYTPQHTECPGHGTAWHRGSSSPRRLQWCLGSHTASSYHVPPNPGTPRANLHEHTHTQQHTRKAEDATCTTVYQSVWNNHTSLLFSVRPHFPSALLTGSVHIYRSNSHIFVSNF